LNNSIEKNNIDYKKLGLRIKEVRLSKNLTQENIADYVGCNISHISNIENNHTKVSLNILLAIANALNTSIDYLLSEQYDNSSLALDNEILRALKDCDDEKKLKILKIISII
jgi:transcriptional regulator with XRE-family HTH domain